MVEYTYDAWGNHTVSGSRCGVAIGATASLASQASSGEISLGSFFIDTAVGAVSGIFSYGASIIASSIGSNIGSALSRMTIKGLAVSKVFTGGILSSLGGAVGYIVGGISSGIFFDKFANSLLGREDNLQDRIKNNFDGSLFSLLLDLVRYLW